MISERENTDVEIEEFTPEQKKEIVDECKVFWRLWAEKRSKEFENIIHGRPQFDNVLKEESSLKKRGFIN